MTKRLLAFGVAILAVGGTAVVTYAAVIDSSGVIHGCYSTNSYQGQHFLTLTDGGCPGGTTPIFWNQQGPQGPAGPSTAGPNGLDTTVVARQGTGSATVFCPADHPYATGGGGDAGLGGKLTDSHPEGPSGPGYHPYAIGWTATSDNPTAVVQVEAVCSK
jgi:hypothetical protein